MSLHTLDIPHLPMTVYEKTNVELEPGQKYPTFVYFSISGEESLCLDPFNQPIMELLNFPLRLLSFDLPYHTTSEEKFTAMTAWAEAYARGEDPLRSFLEGVSQCLDILSDEGIIDPQHLAVGGLSRGGLLAMHLAAIHPGIRYVLGFAPVTELGKLKDFEAIKERPLVKSLDAKNIANELIEKHLRLYIGNRDIAVNSHSCYDFVSHLAETAFQNGVRSPRVELRISPSIGHRGHGTSSKVFSEGAKWIGEKLT